MSFANRYPAHLQLTADTVWTLSPGPSEITPQDVQAALPTARAEIKRRTLQPSWDNASDRQIELLGAIAVHGGQATTQQINTTLGRSNSEWATVRRDLISQGTIYAPRRAALEFTVPTLTPYVLQNYDNRRIDATVEMLSLSTMQDRSGSVR